ncbi:MAG: hypothetical protein HC896_11995 [Bacteroidales bacterium]|nr:hypothetical protein [Bacteroidales bacterium]
MRCFAKKRLHTIYWHRKQRAQQLRQEHRKVRSLFSANTSNLKRDNASVISICEDNNGNIWLGTVGGLQKLNVQKKHYQPQPLSCVDPAGFQIWAMLKDTLGLFWLGTSKGLIRFNPYNLECTLYNTQNAGLSNNGIPALCIIGNELWIGTKMGLNIFDFQSKEYRQYYSDPANENSLPGNSINHILQTSLGDIWVSTTAGLCKYSTAHDGFFTYTTDKWPSAIVFGVLEDKQQTLWASTHHGLVNLKPSGEIIKAYDIDDGLQSNQFLAGAFMKTGDGEMYFGA